MKERLLPPLALACLTLSAWPLGAKTYYVKSDSANVSDSATAQTPVGIRTIQAALNCPDLAPGDTIEVFAGAYNEAANWPGGKSGTADRKVTLKAHPGDKVMWTTPTVDELSWAGQLLIRHQSSNVWGWIRIEGFVFSNAVTRTAIGVFGPERITARAHLEGLEIVNNTFVNNGHNGLRCTNVSRTIFLNRGVGRERSYSGPVLNWITNNTFTGNYGRVIDCTEAHDVEIGGNVFAGTRSSMLGFNGQLKFQARPIMLDQGSSRNWVHHNVISNIVKDAYVNRFYGAAGIRLDCSACNNTFEDNIIRDIDYAGGGQNQSQGIHPESQCHSNIFRRNVVYRIGQDGIRDGAYPTVPARGNIFVNNTVYDVKRFGIYLANSKGYRVENNIVIIPTNYAGAYFGAVGVTDKATNGTFRNNDYFIAGRTTLGAWSAPNKRVAADLTLAGWQNASGETAASISADPLFVNASGPVRDFHLQPGSPAIKAGADGKNLGAYPNGSH